MEVIFSNNVKNALELYRKSLGNYPISRERALKKFGNMINALYNLGTSISTPPICMHKDLGQRFTSDGQPIYKNLKRFNYKDESGFQWAFSCLYNDSADRITIVKMMAASQVKEEIFKQAQLVLEFWDRMKKIV